MCRGICLRLVGLFILLGFSPMLVAAGSSDLPAELVQAIQQGRVKTIDLTYALDDHSPFWPEGSPMSPFHATTAATYQHDGYFARSLQLPEHFGTHMDAPLHFDPKGRSLDEIPVQDFLLEAVVVDVRAAVSSNPDYRLTAAGLGEMGKGAWSLAARVRRAGAHGMGFALAFPKTLHEPGRQGSDALPGFLSGSRPLPA